MADHDKAVEAKKPEAEVLELKQEAETLERAGGEDESVELSEEELKDVAGAGPKPSDDG